MRIFDFFLPHHFAPTLKGGILGEVWFVLVQVSHLFWRYWFAISMHFCNAEPWSIIYCRVCWRWRTNKELFRGEVLLENTSLAEALIQNLAWRRGKTPTCTFSEAHSCEKTQVWVQTPLQISRGVEVKHQQVHFQMRARARKHRALVLAYFKISRGVEVKHQQVHFQDAIFSASMSKSPPQHPNVLVLVPF